MPDRRPAHLQLATLRRSWWRLDRELPERWGWQPFPVARYRFDPAGGSCRVRYAADSPRGAIRERFDESRRVVRRSELELRLVQVAAPIRVLDLRRDRILDALGLDDQINTGRAPGVWLACQRLADLVHDWFGERCDGIVYRSRTTPERGANLAFFGHAPLTARDLGPLGEQEKLLLSVILTDNVTVRGWR